MRFAVSMNGCDRSTTPAWNFLTYQELLVSKAELCIKTNGIWNNVVK